MADGAGVVGRWRPIMEFLPTVEKSLAPSWCVNRETEALGEGQSANC